MMDSDPLNITSNLTVNKCSGVCRVNWHFSCKPKETGRLGTRKLCTQNLLLELDIHFTCSLCLCITNLQHCDGDLPETTTNCKLKSSWNWEFYCERKKTTEHIVHKIWRSLKFCKKSGKRAHPRSQSFFNVNQWTGQCRQILVLIAVTQLGWGAGDQGSSCHFHGFLGWPPCRKKNHHKFNIPCGM